MLNDKIKNKIIEIQKRNDLDTKDKEIIIAALNVLLNKTDISQVEIANQLNVSYIKLNRLIKECAADIFDIRIKRTKLKQTTEQKKELIQQMIVNDPFISQAEIARKLGVSRQAGQQFIQKHFLNFNQNRKQHFEQRESITVFLTPPKQSTLEKIKKFRGLIGSKERYNVVEIAKQCRISFTVYQHWQNDFGASVVQRAKEYNDLIDEVRKMEEEGKSKKLIAKTIGVSIPRLNRWFGKDKKHLNLLDLI